MRRITSKNRFNADRSLVRIRRVRVRSSKFPSERKKLGSGIGGGVFHPVADHFVLGRFTSRDEIFSGGGLSGEFPKSGMLVVDMAMGQHGRADADVALEQRGQTSSLTHNGGNRTAHIPRGKVSHSLGWS